MASLLYLSGGIAIALGIAVGVFLALRSNNYHIALDRNIDDKLVELPSIYACARKSIDISTDFDSDFFGDQRVKDAIENAVRNGAYVRIITEKEPLEWYVNNEQIKIKRVHELQHHRMIIDRIDVRIEKAHHGRGFGQDKNDIALICKGFPKLAKNCSEEFERLWS